MRLAEAVADKDAALSRGLARLEADLEAVTDERDDLSQRIRFLERQLHKWVVGVGWGSCARAQ